MRNTNLFILTIVLVLTFSGVRCYSEKPEIVSGEELKEWISFLASDEMRGRANGSPEMNSVSIWLTEKFKEYGLLQGGLSTGMDPEE